MAPTTVYWTSDQIRALLVYPGHGENLDRICALGLTVSARARLRRGHISYVVQATARTGASVQSRAWSRLEDGLFDVWPRAQRLAAQTT